MQVRALRSIWHNATAHKAGDVFEVSDALAEQLRQAGMVDILGQPEPKEGTKPVESPQVKPRKKSKK
jgi:hypothetical protein